MRIIKLESLMVFLVLLCWSEVSLANVTEQRLSFEHDGYTLSAYFKSPSDAHKVKGVVFFISGDGATPYDADGYYDEIWQVFLDAGYAVFSWDKPGVGQSGGNWLKQSMLNRQSEVRSAISFVKKHYPDKAQTIGVMGFSQAGWVAPALMRNNPDISFMVGVGYAMNWLDQSWYMTKIKLQREKASSAQFRHARQRHQQERLFWKERPSYANYVKLFADEKAVMSEERFNFVRKNVWSDATKDYLNIKQPILILLGDNDVYVDVMDTYNELTLIYNGQDNAMIKIIPDATHGLLKYPEFDDENNDLISLVKLLLLGKRAYAPDFFTTLSAWLEKLDSETP
ncbi:serine aminopeptidase domain-containing protein [Vibrio sp. NH-UV-68]|uniref:alpha/beta hydrolase family protein n=1 Tax=unclassified Vibrio TaxID=2614977 RepID=UPI0036F2AA1B